MAKSPAQRVKTLADDHTILHEDVKDQRLAEQETGSTAYVICQLLELDASDHSFGHVAHWAGVCDEPIAGIQASCERIQRSAATILWSFETDEEAIA